MKTAFEVFWNAEPEEKSELAFLKQLRADLNSAGISATILANYFTRSRLRQVDFLIITEKHACHVELKSYTGVLHGGVNGPWSVASSDGAVEVLADRANPYTQALECKMAVSDDMHAVAEQDSRVPRPPAGKRFYTQIDSVVCLFPNLATGSQVPSDYKVQTLGYADFVRFLTTPGKHPGWTGDHWSALIRLLGLTNATAAASRRTTMRASAAQTVVSSYTRWFRDFYTRDLHELIPLPLNADATALSPATFADFLREAKQVQLVGPSGCGKSHLAKHLLIGLSDGSVPVLVEGTMYDGRLSMLLNRSVARFTTRSAAELLQAAAINGQTVVLVIDGFNECPQSLQERLLGDLSSFCRRTKTITLISSQAAVAVPAPLAGKLVRAGELTAEARQAVLSSYGAPGIVPLCEPFATAYELSIAAECASEIEGTVTRADLFSAFIRKRLSRVSSPAHTRDALRQFALVMNDRLLTSLPLDEVWRVVERHLASTAAPVSVIDDLLSSSLTVGQQGRLSFTHELLGRFLAVEALLLRNQDLPRLVQVLRRPRHEDLTQFAVELEPEGGRATDLLAGLADWNLYAQAVRGNLGPTAARAARTAADRQLRDLTAAMDSTTFTIHPEYELTVAGGRELSAADRALLTAIGALIPEGEFLQEAVSLLDATDAACWRSADVQAKAQRHRPTASGMVATVLVGLGGRARSTVAAPIILESMSGPRLDSRFRSSRGTPPVGADALAGLIDKATPREHGRLLLLCELLQSMHGPDAASLTLRLARLCWESGAYHVQLEGLTTIQSFAAETRDQPLGTEIVDFLKTSIPTT